MATAKIIFDTRRPTLKGTYPVIIRITHHEVPSPLRTGVACQVEQWDAANLKVVKIQNSGRLNATISNCLSTATNYLADNATRLNEMTSLEIRDEIKKLCFGEGPAEKISFYDHIQKIVDELVFEKRVKYSMSFVSLKRSLMNFDPRLDFKKLDTEFLRKYQGWMLSKEMTYGGIAVYMRTLKRACNRAIEKKIMGRDWYPFYDFKIKKVETNKRAISKVSIDALRNLKPKKNTPLWDHWNYFRFYFNARGMNYVDVANIRMSQIEEDRLNYIRRKTKRPYTVALTKEMREIIKHYGKGKKRTEFLFPILKTGITEAQELNAHYEYTRELHVHYLNELGKLAGIKTRLTPYVIRHSWASGMRDSGAPIHAIKSGMGHKNLAITETYLSEIGNEQVDEWNEKFLQ